MTSSTMQRVSRVIFWAALGALGLAFVALFGQLLPLARLAVDDFCVLSEAQEFGHFGALNWWRQNWTGRWVSQGVASLVADTVRPTAAVGVYNGLIFGLLWGASWFFIERFKRFFAPELRSWQSALLALAAMALVYRVQPNREQLWFFLNGSTTHFLPLPLFLLAAALLAAPRPRAWESLGAAVCALLASATGESSVLAIGLLGLGALFWSARHEKEALAARAWPFAIFVIGVVFALTAPGNWNRAVAEGSTAAAQSADPVKLSRGVGHTFRVLFENSALGLLVAFLIGAALFVILQRRSETDNFSSNINDLPNGALRGKPRGGWKWPLLLAMLSLVIQAPGAWAFQGYPPARSWAPTVVLFLIALAMLGWNTARVWQDGPALRTVTPLAATLGCLSLLFFFGRALLVELPTVRAAARSFDAQYAELHQKRRDGCSQTVVWSLLPRQDWVFIGEPMPETDHWISTCMRDAVDLPCDLRRDRP